jgi:hypothetical protein
MNDKKKLIVKFLESGKTIRASVLAQLSHIVENDSTCPITRGLIRELIDDGYCIGSTNQGYRMLTTGREVQEYLNNLLQRQAAMSKRIWLVWKNAKARGITK